MHGGAGTQRFSMLAGAWAYPSVPEWRASVPGPISSV
eukprot:CAMPEP_0180214122 /NCGR_PEP_ID=MMETSP0987-20121128/14678_1 /TAXON_ID=697907 /ORGANISM="non described non described, Strain CCMP2293" /LENGTH=36 /DNA_ID= /DNA_START= /DNA_END= /DNA_ORIENTATION=